MAPGGNQKCEGEVRCETASMPQYTQAAWATRLQLEGGKATKRSLVTT